MTITVRQSRVLWNLAYAEARLRDSRAGFTSQHGRNPRTRAVQEKSDKATDEWKPPLVSFWCTYTTDWVTVKRYCSLTVTTAEKTALGDMLKRCPQ